MTLACARQWQTTDLTSKLHECERAANHKDGCLCNCGARLESCARLPSSGTGPGEVPTRKPSEILADRKEMGPGVLMNPPQLRRDAERALSLMRERART
jgi:hypothetical protein